MTKYQEASQGDTSCLAVENYSCKAEVISNFTIPLFYYLYSFDVGLPQDAHCEENPCNLFDVPSLLAKLPSSSTVSPLPTPISVGETLVPC